MNKLFYLFCFFSALQGIVLSQILFFSKRHKKQANKYLAVFLLLFSIMMLRQFLESQNLIQSYVFIYNISWTVSILFGPLVYLYVISLIAPLKWSGQRYLIHFSVPLAYFLFIIVAYIFDIRTEEDVKNNLLFFYIYIFFQLFQMVQILVYLVLSLFKLNEYHKKLRNYYSNLEKMTLRWLVIFVSILLILYFEWIILYSGDLITTSPRFYPEYIIIIHRVLFIIVVYLIGYFALIRPEIFTIKTENSLTKRRLEKAKIPVYKEKLLRLMDTKKPYLEPTLTIKNLADELSMHYKLVSELINEDFNKSFHDFINEYRIEEVKRNLLNEKNQVLKIEFIALKSGFKSTSTLNRLFKKYTKKTPKEYQLTMNKKLPKS